MHPEQKIELIELGCGMLYEEMTAVGHHTVNGFPTFLSFKWLNEEEAIRLYGFLEELRGFQAGRTGEDQVG